MVAVLNSQTRTSSSSLRWAVIDGARRLSLDMSAYIAVLVEFDLGGEWAFDNAPSCAHWLADRADVELCTVGECLRIGHALRGVDEVARRFADGRLSYSKVRFLTRIADCDNQHELCALAERFPAAQLPVELARWRNERESDDDRKQRQRAATKLSWHVDVDGMVVGSFCYPPEVFAGVEAAVDARVNRALRGQRASAGPRSSHRVGKWPSLGQQRADALVALLSGGGARLVAEIVLHVRGDGCTLDDGTPIAGSVVERLVTDAFVRVLIHDAHGRPINASGRQRHPTTRQKRVVHERDRCCVDCGTTDLLRYDHDPDYEQSHQPPSTNSNSAAHPATTNATPSRGQRSEQLWRER
ncbi:MAG: hypothetical protein ABIQ73_18080 [Acidimicrobiales bacterium]